MVSRNVKSGFAWLLSGNVLYSACQLGIVWVLARLGTVEQVGQYALGMAISAPILMFGDFQLRALIASDVQGRFAFGDYFTFRVAWMLLAIATIAGIAAVTQSDPQTAWIVVAVALVQSLEFVSDTFYGIMQREERLDRLSRSLLVKGPLALGLMTAVMFGSHNVLYAVLALGVGRLAVLLAWDSRAGFRWVPDRDLVSWNSRTARHLFALALPLGLVSMLASVNSNIPRYFLEAYRGSAALGRYSPVASLLTAGTLIISAMGQALFVPVAQAYATGDGPRFRAFIVQAAILAAILGGLGILVATAFGTQILAFIFGNKYGEQTRLLVTLTCAGAISFLVSGLGYIITAARSLNPQVPLMLVSGIVGAAAANVLVPRYGPEGAAAALGVSAAAQLVGTILILVRLDRKIRDGRSAPMNLARSAEGAAR